MARLLLLLLIAGCGSSGRRTGGPGGEGDSGPVGDGATVDVTDPDYNPTDAGLIEGDPTTCEQARISRTYVGCDFYPTVTPNTVKDHFDYAVVVANTGQAPANIVIERGGSNVATGTVAADSLEVFYLPWVMELKVENELCSIAPSGTLNQSAYVSGGAYHLTSSVPVTVYQFNPLQYGAQGGPPGKDWSACMMQCTGFMGISCNSYTNDASLLLPSTVATGNYRVTAMAGENGEDTEMEGFGTIPGYKSPGYISVTGLVDNTMVAVQVSEDGEVVAGGPIPAAGAGEIFTFMINRGDVVRLLGTAATDLAGTLVQGNQPIQVITGNKCRNIPTDSPACDHLEETVFPAETLGREYVVARPTASNGGASGHVVRLVGNADATTLSYPVGRPDGAPSTLRAGQVVEFDASDDFVVSGDHEFAVVTFLSGLGTLGDPAQTNQVAVEQYRNEYVFLAPLDYDVSVADVVMRMGTEVFINGAPVPAPQPIGGSGWGISRVTLDDNTGGRHHLMASDYVGLQVMGYGFATSYQYPGGLNVRGIAPPPPDLI